MALILDELTVWDISFRWAGHDPDDLWFRYPLFVKDNFRLLMEAILNGEIICSTLCLDKLPPESKADPRYYIRTYIDEIYACIAGKKYNRHLLKWAILNRLDFYEWCTRRGIPPPEFWFPLGWKLEFDYEGVPPGYTVHHEEPDENSFVHFSYQRPKEDKVEEKSEVSPEVEVGGTSKEKPDAAPEEKANTVAEEMPTAPVAEESKHPEEAPPPLRPNFQARIACQQIAGVIWKKDLSRTIASVVKDELIQDYGGGKYYENATVREWVKVVAPPEVRQRRGRPRKENGGEDE